MTPADFLSQNFFIIWILIAIALFVFIVLPLIVILRGGSIKIFNWIDINPQRNAGKRKGNDQTEALSRLSKKKLPIDPVINQEKVIEIIKGVPEQSIVILYFRVTIEMLMFNITLQVHGPVMGMGYPGWKYYNHFNYATLIGKLPTRMDSGTESNLYELINDFFVASTPCMNLEKMTEPEFHRLFISGIYLKDYLEKLEKYVEIAEFIGKPRESYQFSDLEDLGDIKKKKHTRVRP